MYCALQYDIKQVIFITYTAGVSLVLLGQTTPNNSLINLDDLVYQAPTVGFSDAPTNAN